MSIRTSTFLTPAKLGYVTIALLVYALVIATNKAPLEGMHWDVPLYLSQAKAFAQSPYLDKYTHQAAAIAASVKGHTAEEDFSHAFWHFMRFGHIVTLGSIVAFFGNSLVAIAVAKWLYVGLLIGGIGFCFGTVLVLVRDVKNKWCYHLGAVISMVLLLFSDIYRYLAGNLVSEVLAIFLLAGSVLAMLQAIKTGRLSLAVLSGLLAFLSYTVRMESIWTWLAFVLAYVATSGGGSYPRLPWQALLTGSLSAGLGYGAYTLYFYPLTNPVYFLQFMSGLSVNQIHDGVPAYQLLFVAGGILWVGALISFWWAGKSGLVRFGGGWLLLAALPWLPQILSGGPAQTRMMTPLILPLFLLSSAGWGLLLVQANKLALKATIAVAVAIALFSQPLVYNGLYHIPGGWRVQQVRPFFFAPKYERIDYFATDVAALSTVLFRPDQSSVLIVPKQVYTESYISLFRFFSPDLDYGIRVYRPNCEDIEAMNGLSVGFCLGYAHPIPSHTKRILSLRRLDSPSTPQSTVMLTTSAYALDKLDN